MGTTTSTHEPLDHKTGPSPFKRHASCRGTKVNTVKFFLNNKSKNKFL